MIEIPKSIVIPEQARYNSSKKELLSDRELVIDSRRFILSAENCNILERRTNEFSFYSNFYFDLLLDNGVRLREQVPRTWQNNECFDCARAPVSFEIYEQGYDLYNLLSPIMNSKITFSYALAKSLNWEYSSKDNRFFAGNSDSLNMSFEVLRLLFNPFITFSREALSKAREFRKKQDAERDEFIRSIC